MNATAPAIASLQLTGSSRYLRILPALAAVAYPGLIWCGTAIAPIFLVLALVVPLLGVSIAHRVNHQLYPRSRWAALAVVATPALYSLLGGWLDFQHALPFKGLHAWVVIWLSTAAIAFWERPSQGSGTHSPAAAPRLVIAHGISAVLITCFAIAHLINHVAGLWGGERHVALQQALRLVYLEPLVEIALLSAIAFQAASGVRLLASKLPRATQWLDLLQAASGLYFVVFFLSHLTAVLRARLLRGIDTNWQWLTGTDLLTDAWSARLAPYYFLSVVALGVHGGAGIHRVMLAHGASAQLADRCLYFVIAAAAALSASIMTALIRA